MFAVLDRTYTLTRADMSTHTKIPFSLPEGVKKLHIDVAYSPKYNYDEEYGLALIEKSMMKQAGEPLMTKGEMRACLPLDNHLSYSIDSPKGAIGTAHRGNDRQSFLISEDFADGGFYPCETVAGEWAFVISATCIITDTVTVSLRIEAEE